MDPVGPIQKGKHRSKEKGNAGFAKDKKTGPRANRNLGKRVRGIPETRTRKLMEKIEKRELTAPEDLGPERHGNPKGDFRDESEKRWGSEEMVFGHFKEKSPSTTATNAVRSSVKGGTLKWSFSCSRLMVKKQEKQEERKN